MSHAFPPGRWRSRWIWAEPTPGSDGPGRQTVALRTEFRVDDVSAVVPVRLVANGRYVLFVNGERAAQGPVRANPRRQPYDDLDLAPFLRSGTNTIGVLVVRYAGATPWYLPPPVFSNDLVHGAFTLEAQLGDDMWLTTSKDWSGAVLGGWTAGPGHGVSGRGIETVDARSLPDGWAGDTDPGWPAVIERIAFTVGEPGRPEPPSYPIGPLGSRPISWPAVTVLPLAGDGSTWTLDRVSVGTLVIDADGPPGSTVGVRTAEFLDPGDQPAPNEHDAGIAFTLDGSRRHLESLDTYGLRGVNLETSAGVRVHGVALHERVHPVAGNACFTCSDPVLEDIWEVGRRTVSICSTDAYLDCPTREQRAWTGDSVVHQMVDLTTNADWSLARWHPRLAASPRPDGMLPMACAGDAEEADFTVIPDWALHWVHSVWNLYRYAGDPDEIGSLLPVVEGVVRWFEQFCDDDGLPTDVYAWVIIDWATVYTEGVCAALCGLWGRALLELAEMADWMGDSGRSSWARRTHERLRDGFERLWDPKRRRYIDSLVPGENRPMTSQHGQAAAIVGDLAPRQRWDRLVEVITHEPDLVHASFSVTDGPSEPNSETGVGALLRQGHADPWWETGRQVVRAQPFFRYVVHDALTVAGRGDLVSRALLDWTWALERCPTSLTETWYGGTVSHGWSSTPTRDCMQRILGVTPAAPGFECASVAPALGHLEWAEGTLPTPSGPLHIRVEPDRIDIDSPVPFIYHDRTYPPGRHRLGTST